MDSADGIVGNIGEWSELYAFCYLLNEGVLKTADHNLNPLSSAYLPVIRIIRKETYEFSYYPKNDSKSVEIYIGDHLIRTVPKSEFESNISLIYSKLITKGEHRTIEIPEVQRFLGDIHCTKLKADSKHKKDIVVQIHDVKTGLNPVQGFSIKSLIGSNPTLLNAGRTTNFKFRLNGCTDSIMQQVNRITEGDKIMLRMGKLLSSGCKFEYCGMHSETFEKNLRMIDFMMPQILSRMLFLHYSNGTVKLSDVVKSLEDEDPLDVRNPGFYIYKLKTMLCAMALGMIPSKPWYGQEDADGGYIIVKDDGNVICFFLYNRNEFEQYLMDYTRFDRASTSRHEYMEVLKEDGEFFIDLNLQIRFIKPGYIPRNKSVETNMDDY